MYWFVLLEWSLRTGGICMEVVHNTGSTTLYEFLNALLTYNQVNSFNSTFDIAHVMGD